ncbi:MAG: dehydrogenase [Bacteroidetes bacterium]|nr:MAG: dehydrogenase [Bacteroidota bacterium]
MHFQRHQLSNPQLIDIYKKLLWPRAIEEKMLVLLRQGKISKWFSGIGQEAISVGATWALHPHDWLMPLHRNLGVFTGRGMPLHQLFRQWQGQANGYTKGRERSFHFGSSKHHICGMISHLGPQLTIANGVALAHKLRQQRQVAVAFTGDGGTSQGDFHEALNVAAVWDLPVIFIIENNGYGLSTPTSQQYRCSRLSQRAVGYGMEGVTIDGNNVLEVIDTINGVRAYCIEHQKPYLIECNTFRMRGHEEASGTKYVPQQLFDLWKQKDPVEQYERFLLETGVIQPLALELIKAEMAETIVQELQLAQQETGTLGEIVDEYADVFYTGHATALPLADPVATQTLRLSDAVKQGLDSAMELYPNLVLMGQDIADYGGAFKVTEGLMEKYGSQRVRNTPLCESAILGAAVGLALEGMRSMVEMQFADFVSVGFNQIVNNLAKMHYRWGQPMPVVVRMPTGAGVGAGPFHSQSTEAWFAHVPGLKVVYPSNPYDAKGLLLAAFADGNPVLYFEHKALYRSLEGPVPQQAYTVPIGKANLVQTGHDLAIITYGAGVHWALEYCKNNPGLSVTILDLRSLQPLDYEAIAAVVKQTGRVLVLHEDNLTGGIGAEVAAWIGEHCFRWLDAPVMRCASLDTPVPFNTVLEQRYLAKSRMAATVAQLMSF